ncbi:MAG: hypothetical protein P4L50_08065 [Anaerolineaceae bacterium]|nr:hypothetical protein [Anaerolineaceae bacterium]
MPVPDTVEHRRLQDSINPQLDWRAWGPYLSERAWGTVREDYSPGGDAWSYFPHDHARSRAYRWNEDGLGGFCNRFQNICLAVALWNEQDPIIKERLFGLSGPEGNHGEDVKEYYFYLDGLPSHAYMKMLYKYPQVEYPYAGLVQENRQRGRAHQEYELVDALRSAFQENRYFDVFIEYAKADRQDILCRITAVNRGSRPAPLHILPHIWFRNTWSWGYSDERPQLQALGDGAIHAQERHLGENWWYAAAENGENPADLFFTENDTNSQRLFGVPNSSPFVKDGINEAVVHQRPDLVNPQRVGTKAAAHFKALLGPGESFSVRLRFSDRSQLHPFAGFTAVFDTRIAEADQFYAAVQGDMVTKDQALVQRQAFAGLLWSKQFYHYNVELWLKGDPAQPAPAENRRTGRNSGWGHLDNLDVLSMPDKWEYPWYAAWDLAFHTPAIARIDPELAKNQLLLLLRIWYMHPNGQLPAYEWSFDDVNPPVHAWAALQVYKISHEVTGHYDTLFLERVFHKLLLNFTWWVNRKDAEGKNVFQGGFLGLDNIGVFDRSRPLPTGGRLEQADGTAWMAMYCVNMLAMALELARTRPAYEDVATKFFEHFIYIANALSAMGGPGGLNLWDEQDGFYYDVLHTDDDRFIPLKIRSFVGLVPLLAVETLEPELLDALPNFKTRLEWFIKNRPHLVQNVASLTEMGAHGHYHLAVVGREKLSRILQRVFDPHEFLSDYGLRALSKYHAEHPYEFEVNGTLNSVHYEPAESSSGLFGGNSNWRGPIWFPANFLLIEALRKYNHHYGQTLLVNVLGRSLTLNECADELSRRLANIFLQDNANQGRRPVFGSEPIFQTDAYWHDAIPFYEYFNGEDGSGVGASHQTGWTALVANLIHEISTPTPIEELADHHS